MASSLLDRRAVSRVLLVVGKMGKGIREQETEPIADRAREGQKPGNMIAYSPEQIISRADAAGQAAYAAVIRAGGAAGGRTRLQPGIFGDHPALLGCTAGFPDTAAASEKRRRRHWRPRSW